MTLPACFRPEFRFRKHRFILSPETNGKAWSYGGPESKCWVKWYPENGTAYLVVRSTPEFFTIEAHASDILGTHTSALETLTIACAHEGVKIGDLVP